jgi:hypothetical protein
MAQREPRLGLMNHRLHALLERVEVVRSDGDAQLHQMQGIPRVDLLQGLAAVADALHRAAVFAADR